MTRARCLFANVCELKKTKKREEKKVEKPSNEELDQSVSNRKGIKTKFIS